MTLRESTSELHSKAEKMPFNQKMFRGELTKEEYISYLSQQLAIFDTIEVHELPHESLKRSNKIFDDIKQLFGNEIIQITILTSTKEYTNYLSELTQEQLLPHVYLNYLAIMFGGQIMKSKVPGDGKMYFFEDTNDCIKSIREIQKDEWADEVNKGFEFIINILDELQENT